MDELFDVATVDRAVVTQPQLLEPAATSEHVLDSVLETVGHFCHARTDVWNALEEIFHVLLEAVVAGICAHAGEVLAHAANVWSDAHFIVIQDDGHLCLQMRGVVERFKGHAAGHGAVADDGDDIAVFVKEIARHSEAVCCRDRGAGVACAEIVVDALAALWKTGHAAVLSERVETVVAPGEQLMHIGLMADVPDELVLWKIVHIMQRQRDLDDAEILARDGRRFWRRPQSAAPGSLWPGRAAGPWSYFLYLWTGCLPTFSCSLLHETSPEVISDGSRCSRRCNGAHRNRLAALSDIPEQGGTAPGPWRGKRRGRRALGRWLFRSSHRCRQACQ